jgi:hypothetical protein
VAGKSCPMVWIWFPRDMLHSPVEQRQCEWIVMKGGVQHALSLLSLSLSPLSFSTMERCNKKALTQCQPLDLGLPNLHKLWAVSFWSL